MLYTFKVQSNVIEHVNFVCYYRYIRLSWLAARYYSRHLYYKLQCFIILYTDVNSYYLHSNNYYNDKIVNTYNYQTFTVQ